MLIQPECNLGLAEGPVVPSGPSANPWHSSSTIKTCKIHSKCIWTLKIVKQVLLCSLGYSLSSGHDLVAPCTHRTLNPTSISHLSCILHICHAYIPISYMCIHIGTRYRRDANWCSKLLGSCSSNRQAPHYYEPYFRYLVLVSLWVCISFEYE